MSAVPIPTPDSNFIDDDDWEVRPAPVNAVAVEPQIDALDLVNKAIDATAMPASVSSSKTSTSATSSTVLGRSVSSVSDSTNLTQEDKTVLDQFSPLKKFIERIEFLLTSVSLVFPKCMQTKMVISGFKSYYKYDEKHQEELIRLWHQMMTPYYADVTSTDPKRHARVVGAKIEIFQRLELPKKWNDKGFTTKSRENLLKQIAQLNKYAQLFCGFHTQFKDKVLGAASEIRDKIASGEMQEDNLEALMQKGVEVAENMSDEDLAHIAENLPAIMKQMGGSLGGGSGGPAFDESMFIKMFSKGK